VVILVFEVVTLALLSGCYDVANRFFMLFKVVLLTLLVTKVFCVATRVLLSGCYRVLSGC